MNSHARHGPWVSPADCCHVRGTGAEVTRWWPAGAGAAAGAWQVEPRDATASPAMHRAAPTAKTSPAERHLRQGRGGPAAHLVRGTHLTWSVPGTRAGIPTPWQVPEACLTVFLCVDLRVTEPALGAWAR